MLSRLALRKRNQETATGIRRLTDVKMRPRRVQFCQLLFLLANNKNSTRIVFTIHDTKATKIRPTHENPVPDTILLKSKSTHCTTCNAVNDNVAENVMCRST